MAAIAGRRYTTYLTTDSLLPALAYLTYLLDQNLDLQLHT